MMFDKLRFAQIIKNIKETYSSQEDFSKKSGIGRTYLSQYMNMKLNEPPKPKILEKLADASNGITTYNELMLICNYLNDDFDRLMGDSVTVYTCPYTLNLKYNQAEKFIFDSIYSYENLNDFEYTDNEKKQIVEIYNYIKNNETYKRLIQEYEKIKKENFHTLEGIYNAKDEQEFKFAYHKEMEGLTDEEIADALRFYKEMKKKVNKNNN